MPRCLSAGFSLCDFDFRSISKEPHRLKPALPKTANPEIANAAESLTRLNARATTNRL